LFGTCNYQTTTLLELTRDDDSLTSSANAASASTDCEEQQGRSIMKKGKGGGMRKTVKAACKSTSRTYGGKRK
jgi:hypothetical protein